MQNDDTLTLHLYLERDFAGIIEVDLVPSRAVEVLVMVSVLELYDQLTGDLCLYISVSDGRLLYDLGRGTVQ